jgi:(p)ppGpp synthase/HD superfamily hydrolase
MGHAQGPESRASRATRVYTARMPNLEDAIDLATRSHRGQTDRYGAPFVLHPLRVMLRLETDAERIVGVLHDIVEKTPTTLEQLRTARYSEEILAALDCVTRRKGESYDAFVERAAANPLAARVKLADLEDNMDLRRARKVRPEDAERFDRYVRAWQRLHGT